MKPETRNLKPAARAELETLARAVRDSEAVIDQLKDRTLDHTAEVMREIILQGDRLRQAKALVPHGQWLTWLASHFAKTDRTAQFYMRVAANPKRVSDFIEARSLRQALALLPEETDASANPGPAARSWPAFIEAVGRMGKVLKYIEKNPVDQWPAENRDRLKEELQPLVKKLWPEQFALPRL